MLWHTDCSVWDETKFSSEQHPNTSWNDKVEIPVFPSSDKLFPVINLSWLGLVGDLSN